MTVTLNPNSTTIKHQYVMDYFNHATGHYSKSFDPDISNCLVMSFSNKSNLSQNNLYDFLYHQIVYRYKFYQHTVQSPVGAIAFPHHSDFASLLQNAHHYPPPDCTKFVLFARNDYERKMINFQMIYLNRHVQNLECEPLQNYGRTIIDTLDYFMTPFESDHYYVLSDYKPMVLPLSATKGLNVNRTELKRTAFKKRMKLEEEMFFHDVPPII